MSEFRKKSLISESNIWVNKTDQKMKLAKAWLVCDKHGLLSDTEADTIRIKNWYIAFGWTIGKVSEGADISPYSLKPNKLEHLKNNDYNYFEKLFQEEGIIQSEQPQ